MPRSLKNIMMILLILILGGAMFLTINYAKNDANSYKDISTNIGNNIPNGNKEGMGTPPEKPNDNNNSTNSSDTESTAKDQNDDRKASDDSNMKPPDMNNNSNMEPINEKISLSVIYYLLFGVESLVIALVIIYLIMSRFNKKKFKEVLSNKDKVIIYILLSLILTFSLTVLISFSTSKYIGKTNMDNSKNDNIKNSNNDITYSSSNTIDKDKTITSGQYSSSSSDEIALLTTGKVKANLSNITVTKTGDSDGGDTTSFYGTNSAILAKSGAVLTINNINVETNSTGSNGVFSYGGSVSTDNKTNDGTEVNISDSKIVTRKDNSGGIMTTGGGIMKATNLDITTNGISSAAIRTDRGGGSVTVNKGTYKTIGQGSPSIYSTAKINVSDAILISQKSEGIIIEGKNTVSIDKTTLTDTNNKLNGKSTTYKNIFIYQSMSGDASSGEANFKATNSKITTNKGDTLYVTNTSAKIELSNNTFINNDKTGNFLRIKKDSWGNEGSNGGDVKLILKNQKVEGNIVVDSISKLNMNLKNNSSYEGTINASNEAKKIKIKLDKSSKIILTGDSYVTSLDDSDTSYSNIDFNGYKLYVNNKAIN